MCTDAHLHLQDLTDPGSVRDIFARFKTEEDRLFFCNSTSPDDWERVRSLAAAHPGVIPFFGIHPWFAGKAGEGWEAGLEAFLEEPASGIGEIGLDGLRETAGFDLQKEIFVRQVFLAVRLKKPFVVHSVKAWGPLLEILKARLEKGARFMVHSFRGSGKILAELLDLGAYVSFSWKVLREQRPETLELLAGVPAERLLLETDFPYTQPGRTGHEICVQKYFSCLEETYRWAAHARGLDPGVLKEAVFRNATLLLYGAPSR